MNQNLLEKYHAAPADPGVYLMKNEKSRIIYVGKALNLKKRLASYFTKESGHDLKTGILIRQIEDFELIVTSSEHEALILESTLIKKHKPKYNVILKDGKNYPCLRIDVTADYPGLEIVRKINRDNAFYFGPYSSAHGVKSTLKSVNRIFRLRKCRKTQFANRSRPCLNYQIKSCLGPCCNEVSREEYHKIVKDVVLFLKGRSSELVKKLTTEMRAEAEKENFEKAAQLRDTVSAVEKILEKQVVVSTDHLDRDVIACVGEKEKAIVTLFFVRGGNLVGTRHFPFDMHYNDIPEILDAFIKQYYEKSSFLPAQLLVSQPVENRELIEQRLSEKKGKSVKLLVPRRGEKKQIIDMALLNGQKELERFFSREAQARESLLSLQKILHMDRLPRRIECFDNSNISGTDPVSSMVVFINGVPDSSLYRKFIIRDVTEHDDYAYMTEVLTRRFSKARDDMALPDLVVVDGGKGQISMAVAVLKTLGLEGNFAVAGLAKKNPEKGETHDKIYLPNRSNPVNTGQAEDALFLVQRLRDEAHRFAITFQRRRRGTRAKTSILDSVHGIGKKRKQTLLSAYQGISRMKQASVAELASHPGMTRPIAEHLAAALEKCEQYP
ncbi:MAG: excinuclease ABC subunit UvrC [Desulfobacteraceae bacterium]